MQEYLKHYRLRITALAPIHVGDGSKIGKKEYIQQGLKKPIIVPDVNKMFDTLCRMKKENAYMKFMLDGNNQGLGQWLDGQRIDQSYIDSWKRYSLDPGDAFVRKSTGKRNGTPKEILSFIKDAYEKPYVPGSTLKGMLRTAILCWRIYNNPTQYQDKLEKISRSLCGYGSRKNYLKGETEEIEAAVFHTLHRNKDRKGDALNSIMSGFIVSDSTPLDEGQLILVQKIDFTLRGEEKTLPILREALKPGTKIDFELTIDTRICDVTIEEVLDALEYFQNISYDYFYSRFKRGGRAKGIVWLGGGTGFLSKTVLYPLYEDKAVKLVNQIFKTTLGKNYSQHKHEKDIANKVAPHVCKCTRYKGKLYDMGMGKIELLE